MRVVIHTDGSGVNRRGLWNSNHGGCGVVLDCGDMHAEHSFGSFRNTTSARMEIFAIIKALDLCSTGHELQIRTDNQYCQKTISNQWYENWIMSGADKKNMDLWTRFKKVYDKHIYDNSTISVVWVKGHANGKHPGNDIADDLAGKGRIKTQIVQDDRNGIHSI